MGFRRAWCGLGVAALLFGCSYQGSKPADDGAEEEPRAVATVPPVAPVPPAQAPELPATGERDADGNRVDDVLDERAVAATSDAATARELVTLQVILTAPMEQSELDDFVG